MRIGAMATHHEVEISPLHARASARCWPRPPATSATCRCATWAPSAAASRMPIRRPIIRRRCWRWRRGSGWCPRNRTARSRPRSSSSTRSRRRSSPAKSCSKCRCRWRTSSEGHRYQKVAHPASGFAVVGVAARDPDEPAAGSRWRASASPGMGPRGFRARAGRDNCWRAARTSRRRSAAIGDRRGGELGPVRHGRVSPAPGARVRGARGRGRRCRGRREDRRDSHVEHAAGARLRAPAGSRGAGALHARLREPGADRRGRIRHADEDGAGERLRPVPGQGADQPSRTRPTVSACSWRHRQDRLHEGRRPAEARRRGRRHRA